MIIIHKILFLLNVSIRLDIHLFGNYFDQISEISIK